MSEGSRKEKKKKKKKKKKNSKKEEKKAKPWRELGQGCRVIYVDSLEKKISEKIQKTRQVKRKRKIERKNE